MIEPIRYAPGQPGLPPRWTSSAKSAVGSSLTPLSHVWFTIGNGILTEIYYPNVDRACTRDMQLLVSDGNSFLSEEREDTHYHISPLAEGVPAYRLVNTCKQRRFQIEKEILTDPIRDVLLQKVRFVPLRDSLSHYHLFVLLAPRLNNRGGDNTAFVNDYKGKEMLFAEQEHDALALACSVPWLKRSVGFVGVSDGWQDVSQHKQMEWTYTRAENGNVALAAEIDLQSCQGEFVLALAFGRAAPEAAHRATASLLAGFDAARDEYIAAWRRWLESLPGLESSRRNSSHLARISASVLRIHEAKRMPGGLIASLSIPWGFSRGDDDLGGYHLVWPRDLSEAAGALLALGAKDDVHRILHYLHSTQEGSGYWPQNMRVDGTQCLQGIQLDETAAPILLLDLARREEALESSELMNLWPMVKKAAGYIARIGPVTHQDRWEEEPGYSPFTLAVEIAALLAAADQAESNGESILAAYFRETADYWNANIERWTYLKDTKLARGNGVEGYYARVADSGAGQVAPNGEGQEPTDIISPDALALIRFGLRMPDDPRVANTVKVVDALLKVDTPHGPLWRRSQNDTYGEYDDGRPFDRNGKGRLWPLLTGERAHYELALGNRAEAERLLHTFASCATAAGMLPEQIWDGPNIPERQLFFAKPTGSAMPLVWTHAEYLKLLRSLHDNRVFDLPSQTIRRYLIARTDSAYAYWKGNHKLRVMPAGKKLRVELLAPATVHWSGDNWNCTNDTPARDLGIGLWAADLPTEQAPPGAMIRFTFLWDRTKQWEGKNFEVRIVLPREWIAG